MTDEKPESFNDLIRREATGSARTRARRQALEGRLRGQPTEPENTEHDNVENEEETESDGYPHRAGCPPGLPTMMGPAPTTARVARGQGLRWPIWEPF